jgi:TATA-binding protein-associated factor
MEKLKHLHQQVLPFILRREKHDVLKELPPKIISDIPCTMTDIQRRIYADHLSKKDTQDALKILEGLMKENEETGQSNSTPQRSVDQNVLKSLLSLRLICTHPVLASKQGTIGGSDSMARFDTSGKLLALNDLLRRAQIFHDEITAADNDESLLYVDDEDVDGIRTEDTMEHDTDAGILEQGGVEGAKHSLSKCLIFAQYTKSLDVVEELVFKPLMPSLRYVRLDGRTDLKDRAAIVEAFQTDDSIKCMLLTSKVGSLGLNLQAADTVIFLESDWNPFVDLQAMDRTHRIGQQQNVKVYRLVTTESIEEKIMALQQVKIAMSNAIVNTDNSTLFSMGTDRLLDLFTTEDSA